MSLIEINSISKHYGRKKVLNNITFTGEAGDCIGIIGSNGCGKSTLLKILSGAQKPSHGKINDFFQSFLRDRKPIRMVCDIFIKDKH